MHNKSQVFPGHSVVFQSTCTCILAKYNSLHLHPNPWGSSPTPPAGAVPLTESLPCVPARAITLLLSFPQSFPNELLLEESFDFLWLLSILVGVQISCRDGGDVCLDCLIQAGKSQRPQQQALTTNSEPSLNSGRQQCHGDEKELIIPSHGCLGCFQMLHGSWDTEDQALTSLFALHHQFLKQVKRILGGFSHRRRPTCPTKSTADSDVCLIFPCFEPRPCQSLLMFYLEKFNQMDTSWLDM